MALDTRERRQAAAVISHYFMGPGVTMNATPDQEWRQEVAWGYPGILAGEAEEVIIPEQAAGFLGGGSGRGIGGISGDIDRGVYVVYRSKKRSAGGLGPRKRKIKRLMQLLFILSLPYA